MIHPDFEDYEAAGKRGDREEYDSLADSIESNQTLNVVFIGVGGALVVTGAVLLLWPESESQVSLSGGRDGAMAVWSTNF